MELTLTLDLLFMLFVVAIAAGFVDSIAGGGGLITIPALLSVGMPPIQALATNKLQATGGSLSASFFYIRIGAVKLKELRLSIFMAFVGSALGTVFVQMIDPSILQQIIPLLLVGIVLYFLFSPNVNDHDSVQKVSLPVFACTAAIAVGFYDGFFGPGTGSFFAVAFVSLMGFSITKATAHTKILNCTSNLSSLLFFIIGGKVVWIVGLVMMGGQAIGAILGSKVVMSNGKRVIRPMIVVVSLAMTAKLLMDNYGTLLLSWI